MLSLNAYASCRSYSQGQLACSAAHAVATPRQPPSSCSTDAESSAAMSSTTRAIASRKAAKPSLRPCNVRQHRTELWVGTAWGVVRQLTGDWLAEEAAMQGRLLISTLWLPCFTINSERTATSTCSVAFSA